MRQGKLDMMVKVLPWMIPMWILVASCSPNPKAQFRLMAEFEPTERIWLQWQEGSYLRSPAVDSTLIDLMAILHPHVGIRVLLDDTVKIPEIVQRLQQRAIDVNKVTFSPLTAKAAITDASPVYVEGLGGRLGTVDFSWNNYGVRKPGHPKTLDGERFDRDMAAHLHLPIWSTSSLVWEGGAMEHNGAGTMILTEQVQQQRNPDWSKADIEKELGDKLGIAQVIWLKNGPSEDDFQRKLPGGLYPFGTGGHVDEFCRFADARTILIAAMDESERALSPVHQETFERMEENYEILQQARDQQGQPFHIVRVPIPDLQVVEVNYEEIDPGDLSWFPGAEPGDTVKLVLATSYLNFIIANDLVIAAKYWMPGRDSTMLAKDQLVQEIFEEHFPERRIVQLNPEAYNHMGGGFHCFSYNEPKAGTD